MKKFILKCKKMTAVLLITFLTALHTSSYGDDGASCVKVLKNFGNFIIKIERRFSDFFDYNNSTIYSDYIDIFDQLFTELEAYSAVRSVSGILTNDVLLIISYSRDQFYPALNVIKKYKGKGKEHANSFVVDLKRVFDLDNAFATIKTKLQTLLAKARAANNQQLIDTIQQLIVVIEKKMNEWTKKGSVTLFGGLCHRMTCR